MDPSTLQPLNLNVRHSGDTWEADLDLTASLINPLNQRLISRATFTHVGDQLMPIAPPELVGLPPINVKGLRQGTALETELVTSYDEYVLLLQRKSDELQALGISPNISPESLLLSAEVQADNYLFSLVADKRGTFQIQQVAQDGQLLRSEFGQVFDISEFRERQSLASYLVALVNHSETEPAALKPSGGGAGPLYFDELAARFGKGGTVPSRSSLEVLITLRVGDMQYRFAAARLNGRTFRGILAGPQGKLWAERFELEDFPGVQKLLADTLGVSAEQVSVVEPGVE